MSNFSTGEPSKFYERRLPSGGYVAIQVSPVRTFFGPPKMRGEIVVERRPESRRKGHIPPIAACAERKDAIQVVTELLPIAKSDSLLSEVLQRRVIASVTAGRNRPVS